MPSAELPGGVDIARFEVLLKFVFQVGANCLPVSDTKNRWLRVNGLGYRELPRLVLKRFDSQHRFHHRSVFTEPPSL